MKRFISLLLTAAFVLTLLPADIVRANLQNPVPSLIINNDSTTGTNYDFTLVWTRPGISNKADRGNQTPHDLEGYELFYRNATANEIYPAVPESGMGDFSPTDTSFKFPATNLAPASFYAFKVEPWHIGGSTPPGHGSYQGPNQTNWVSYRANLDPSMNMPEAIYMTDLRVEAENTGLNKEITVTWDNPRYNDSRNSIANLELVKDYNIYIYQTGTARTLVASVNIDTNPSVSKDGNKLKYIFNAPNSYTYGEDYYIEVRPMFTRLGGTPTGRIQFTLAPGKVANGAYSGREFTAKFQIKPGLIITPYGQTSIKLTWDSLSSLRLLNPANPMVSVVIRRFNTDTGIFDNIGKYENEYADEVNYFFDNRPSVPIEYHIRIMFQDGTFLDSLIVESPSLTIDYWPYIPTIYKLDPIGNAAPFTVDMTWLAFMREPYDSTETRDPAYNNMYIDDKINYTLWVTDDMGNFDTGMQPLSTFTDLPATGFVLGPYTDEPFSTDDPRPTYIANVDIFTQKQADGSFVEKPMVDNKVYYFKLIGTKTDPATGALRTTPDAFNWVYIPPAGAIVTTPIMLSAPPLRIKKDNGVDMITETTIAIEWDTKWIEAYNPQDNRWYSCVGFDSGNNIVWGDALRVATNLITDNYTVGGNLAPTVLRGLLSSKIPTSNIFLREMDLKNAGYKIHVVPYNDMIKGNITTYTQYIEDMLIDTPPDDEHDPGSKWNTVWTDITPDVKAGQGDTLYYDGAELQGLTPNTPYVIFLRPYTINASYYPTFVTATTLEDRPPLDPIPVAPIIDVIYDKTTDTSVTVRFTYTQGLQYTLYYSELAQDYPANGTPISWPTIQGDPDMEIKNEINPETGRMETYLYYTIRDLFPETVYYFWVGANAPTNNIIKVSNPVTETTKELAPPKPPRAFGPATNNNLNVYNKANSTQYEAIGPDYLIFEWMRDVLDTAAPAAENAGTNAQGLTSALIPAYYMSLFNNLDKNRTYYARAKTTLAVTKGSPTGLVRDYSYTIQLATDAAFTDIVGELTIPPITGTPGPGCIIKESDWTQTVYLITNGGYGDGDVNEKHFPLPNKNYEILYNDFTKALTYRFRVNEKDQEGNNDNNVDQRFISDLVKNGNFVFDIDLSSYGGKEIRTREVILPYSIAKAFDERKVSLKVISNTLSVTYAPGSFNTAEVKAVRDYGVASQIKLTIAEGGIYPKLAETQAYANVPQNLFASVTTPTRTVNLTNTAVPMEINIKLNNRYAGAQSNIGAYVSDKNTGGWQRLATKYDNISGTFSLSSKKLANFAAISRSAPAAETAADDAVADSMAKLSSKIDMRDLTTYNPNGAIHPNQFNLLVLGLSRNQTSVDVNTPMTNEQISVLGKAGMLVSGSRVPLEAGINALVRLYENKAGRVKSFPKANESSFSNIASVTAQYQTAMLKAEEIGMLDQFTALNPKKDMTFSEVLYILDIIIDDAGL